MNAKTEVIPPNGGNEAALPPIVSGEAIVGKSETAITASAAQARAAVEARFVMALHRPRDLDNVRLKLMSECKRPRFAEVARYRRPIGNDKTIQGPSIRFAEAAIRQMGNIDQQTHTIYDDAKKRILRVEVTDLETNSTYSKELTISKTVERRKLRRGQEPLGTRANSYGDQVYIVEAAEGELSSKQDAEISKALRTLSLRLLPGDILDECMEQCIQTEHNKSAEDPAAARKRIADSFGSQGVQPSDLKAYLGHDLATCSPAELQQLRHTFSALRDGFTTWVEIMEARDADDKAKGDAPDEGDTKSRTEQLRESIAQKAEEAKAKEKEPAEETPKDEEAAKEAPEEAKQDKPAEHDADTGELSPEQEKQMELEQQKEAKGGKRGKKQS